MCIVKFRQIYTPAESKIGYAAIFTLKSFIFMLHFVFLRVHFKRSELFCFSTVVALSSNEMSHINYPPMKATLPLL